MIVYDIQDLVKIYPGREQPVNKHITLQIHQGEIFGILGDNGAGKTTLVRQMVNLLKSTSGHITLFGQDITQDTKLVPEYVGYMPQESNALNNLTVGEALFFTAHLRGMNRTEAKIVLSLMFGIMNNIEGHFVFMRFQGMLDYFATLPIKRPILILSLVAAFLCIALPSLLITIIAGSFILGIHLTINPLIILVMPLCAMSVSGIGALIGVHARTPEEAGAISLLINMLLMSIGPVVIPPDHLPAILLFLGHFSPTTYAASALRQVLIGPVTGELAIDIAILAGVTIVIFWLVGRNMNWRRVS
jgi:ABC-2 type transport system permease protein